ncbi:MAG: hypothetical protein GVY19_14005 [Bacteroidetes bacterium]|jgi:predicted nuclease of predicted toxin-antitoxin system|nr:hypothetical protein [Bacteroidota bacterium]
MKFLVDANLPNKLAKELKSKGYDVIHTDDLKMFIQLEDGREIAMPPGNKGAIGA